ncbi:hypothetical protein HRbin27_02043 [bacterium HR27]|nr:hypothetical protein HRbin27_02043 [bacterium HR27]
MVDLHRNVRLVADPDRFLECLEQSPRLAPDVCDVQATEAPHLSADGDDLLGRGISIRRIDQGVGHAESAILHRLGDEPSHGGQLVSRGRGHVVPLHIFPHGAASDERADVGCYTAFHHRLEPVTKATPLAGSLFPLRQTRREVGTRNRLPDTPAERCRRPTLTHDFSRHALRDLRHRPAIPHERVDGVALDVDEPRTDDAPTGIDDLTSLLWRETPRRSDRDDPVAPYSHIAPEPRIPCPIDDPAVPDEKIALHRSTLRFTRIFSLSCSWREST